MRRFRGLGSIIGLITASAAITSTAGAADLPLGPPINITKPFAIDVSAYALLPLSAPDPGGGLPWGVATYRAQRQAGGEFVCSDLGRLQNGRLGIVTADNTLRPYEPGGGLDSRCGGLDRHNGSGYTIRVVPERLPADCDIPTTPTPGVRCPTDGPFRTVFTGALGRGILSAETTIAGRTQRIPVTPNGDFIAVFNGTYTDATLPSIQLTVAVCGADARFDLTGSRMTKKGCSATLEFPTEPRPARESQASRRARRSPRVQARLRVIERAHAASARRFTARLTVPITVRSLSEGYAYRVSGPAGPSCRSHATVNPGANYFSSYLQIEGKTYDLPIVPPGRRWCPGRYDLTFLFVRRTGPKPADLTSKKIATTTFTAH